MIRVFIFACGERAPDFVSRKIMQSLKTNYSHVGIIISADGFWKNGTMHHAIGEGVCEMPVTEYIGDHDFPYVIDVTRFVNNIDEARGWLKAMNGIEYSDSQYAGFIAKLAKPFVRNGKSKFICSELCATFLNECTSIRVFENADLDFIDPKAMLEGLLTCIDKADIV